MLPDQPYCVHCGQYQSSDISQIIEHCRSCSHMPRSNPFLHKFVCYLCTYSSYNIGNIRKHIRRHLGDKPFACNLCDYKSVQKDHVQKHMTNRHPSIEKSEWIEKRLCDIHEATEYAGKTAENNINIPSSDDTY